MSVWYVNFSEISFECWNFLFFWNTFGRNEYLSNWRQCTSSETCLFLFIYFFKKVLFSSTLQCFFIPKFQFFLLNYALKYYWSLNQRPAGFYLRKVNCRNTRTRCEIASQWRRSGVFIVNFEHISQLLLVFMLLTLNM